ESRQQVTVVGWSTEPQPKRVVATASLSDTVFKVVASAPGEVGQAAVTPDGRRLVFFARVPGTAQDSLYAVDLSAPGEATKVIGDDPSGLHLSFTLEPSPSPDRVLVKNVLSSTLVSLDGTRPTEVHSFEKLIGWQKGIVFFLYGT